MSSSHGVRHAFARFLAGLALASVPASGVAQTWSGITDNNWNTGTNWVGDAVPGNNFTTTVVFDASASTFTPFTDLPWLLNRVEVLGAVPYALSGESLTFDSATASIVVVGAGHSIANPLGVVSTLTVSHTDDVLFSGAIAGGGTLTKNGPARLTLTGSSLPGGTLTIGSGTLRLGNGASGPANAFDIVNNGALEANLAGGIFVNGAFTGTGTVSVLSGLLGHFLAGGFTHAGTTSVSAGAQLDGGVFNNARLTLDGIMNTGGSTVGSLEGSGNLSINGGTFTVGGDDTTTTFTGGVFGPGALTKTGSGHLTLSGSSMTSGTITIASGTLQLGAGGPMSGIGSIVNNSALETDVLLGLAVNGTFSGTGTLTVLGGMVAQFGPPFTYTGATTINSGGQLDASIGNNAPLTIAFGGFMNTGGSTVGSLAGGGNLSVNGGLFTVGTDNTDTVFTGNILSNGSIDKVGIGRLTLTGLTLPTGTTTVSAGTLQLGDGVNAPSGSIGPLVVNAALEVNAPAGFAVFSTLSGSGTLTVLGGLMAQFSTPFTHAGTTTVNAGGELAATVTNNALLTVNGVMNTGGATVGSLAGAGQLNINSGTVTVGGDNTSTTFSGAITAPGNLVKTGTGRLTLSGTNTYGGGTTINAGSIFVTGSMMGPVTVNAGATFGGTGTVNGSVTVNAGGTLSPGLSPGLLNTGNLAVVGVLLEEIEGTTLGTQYDSINVTGTVDLTAGTLVLAGAYAPALGNTFTIITNDGVDAVTGTFAGLAEGATVFFNGATLQISYIGGTGNDVVLTVLAAAPAGATSIPSSSDWSLAILALLILMAGALAARRVERR